MLSISLQVKNFSKTSNFKSIGQREIDKERKREEQRGRERQLCVTLHGKALKGESKREQETERETYREKRRVRREGMDTTSPP